MICKRHQNRSIGILIPLVRIFSNRIFQKFSLTELLCWVITCIDDSRSRTTKISQRCLPVQNYLVPDRAWSPPSPYIYCRDWIFFHSVDSSANIGAVDIGSSSGDYVVIDDSIIGVSWISTLCRHCWCGWHRNFKMFLFGRWLFYCLLFIIFSVQTLEKLCHQGGGVQFG